MVSHPPKVFISYSHKDETWKDRVVKHLQVLAQDGKLETWDDRRIAAGDDWFPEIQKAMESCDVALLLISADFLTSNFIRKQEVPKLLQRRINEGVRVIPVILWPCPWTQVSWLQVIQARPKDGKPLSSMTKSDAEAALAALAEEILKQAAGPGGASPQLMSPSQAQVAPTRLRHGAERLVGREGELGELDEAWEEAATHVVTIVAWGGVGKTSLVVEWMGRKAAAGWVGFERVFDWSFYSQGTREQGAASADAFVAKALTFFGDEEMAKGAASPWDKGARLAQLVAERRSLLVLDGVEPLQYPPGPLGGQLKDPALEALLRGLAQQNPGLCVVTTREHVADLAPFRDTTAPEWVLENLSEEAGAALLQQAGARRAGAVEIKRDDPELRAASRDVEGHALTLRLLGSYLGRAHQGDIRKRDRVEFEKADAKTQGGHAFKTMAAYEKWLGDGGEDGARALAVLRLLGLFDRPADGGCLAALRREPAIAGLTEPLVGLGEEDWNLTVSSLEDCGLLSRAAHEELATRTSLLATPLDAHPLIREYFGRQLREQNAEAWCSAHRRLYEHLKDSTKDKPEPTLEDLQPLYQAVAHGCQAGSQQEACDKVYRDRILRGRESYSVFKLGAFGAHLGATACFFEHPWDRISRALSEDAQAWLLNEAAFCLRALGRATEALEPMRATLQINVGKQKWEQAAVCSINLWDLELTLGDVSDAVRDAARSVVFADRKPHGDWRIRSRAALADATHQAGRRSEALAGFREAEDMQAEEAPQYPLLFSVQGFLYCELLLGEAERAAWECAPGLSRRAGTPGQGEDAAVKLIARCREVEARAAETLEWEEGMRDAPLLDLAVHHLTLGRAAFYRALLTDSKTDHAEALQTARQQLTAAVDGLRRAGTADYVPHGLLSRAWLRYLDHDADGARMDLDDAWQIAERGRMRLHMADIHLYRVRLFHAAEPYPWGSPKDDLGKARKLIEECGYHRRDEELADAERLSEK